MIPTSPQSDKRLATGLEWAARELGRADLVCTPVSGDASFRRYFRLQPQALNANALILMDAPPDREDCRPFVRVAELLRQGGVHAPLVLASDLENGFLLLEDLGDTLLRDVLHTNNADQWFEPLLNLLEAMANKVSSDDLPAYERDRLLTELELFPEWYLQRHHGIHLSCEDWDIWEALCTHLITSAQQQPQVFVHRDFHSCNLLLPPDGDIGVIDFQDAVRGPITYDLSSLLWDRYIRWPRLRLEGWMEDFRLRAARDTSAEQWQRWCDWMGLQRNLKIVGIFARLHYRDGKAGYLNMVPQFWRYLQDVLPRYPEFSDFHDMLERLPCAP